MSEPPQPSTVAVAERGGVAVHARNEQLDDPVELPRFAELARSVLEAEGAPAGTEMTLLFVDEREIAALNERFLGGSGPTDVLSFPIDGHEGADGEQPLLVGDVVVCPSVARRNAAGHAGAPDDEIALLVVHGVLHLLGMDHAEPSEQASMQASERRHLSAFWGPLAGDPWSS